MIEGATEIHGVMARKRPGADEYCLTGNILGLLNRHNVKGIVFALYKFGLVHEICFTCFV